MQKTDAELLIEANIIKNETNAGANTANRVGVMLVDVIDSKINNTGAGGAQNLDQVLTAGNNSTQIIYLADSLTTVTQENQIAPTYVYMYDNVGGEAEINPNCFYAYKYIGGQGVWVQGLINNGTPYIEVVDGVNNNHSYLYADHLSYNNTVDLYFPTMGGTLKIIDHTEVVDLSGTDFNIINNGVYELINAFTGFITFPDPTLFTGQSITIINTNLLNRVDINDTNTFAPYWNGSDTKVPSIGAAQMMIFTAINGKWRGGLIYD